MIFTYPFNGRKTATSPRTPWSVMRCLHTSSMICSLILALSACGGGKGTPTLGTVSISLSPPSVTLAAGATQQFTASVTGTTNTTVAWSLQEG